MKWLAIALLACAGCGGCTIEATECRQRCEAADLVVSHWTPMECDCADERAPAYTEVNVRRRNR